LIVAIEPPSQVLDSFDALRGRLAHPEVDVVGIGFVEAARVEAGTVDPLVDHASPHYTNDRRRLET